MADNRTLCEWEVEEFIEHISSRPKLWFGKDKLWIRRDELQRNRFAVKFINGLPDNMSTLQVKVLTQFEDPEDVQHYVDWFLHKFTSYHWRKRVESVLRGRMSPDDAERYAVRVCDPSLSAWQDTLSSGDVVAASSGQSGGVTSFPSSEVSQADKAPSAPRKRSAYIDKLIKGSSR